MDDGGELLGTPRLKNGLAYYPGVRTAQGIVLVGNVVQLNLLTPSGTPYVGFGHLKGVWLWRDQPYIRVQYLAPAASNLPLEAVAYRTEPEPGLRELLVTNKVGDLHLNVLVCGVSIEGGPLAAQLFQRNVSRAQRFRCGRHLEPAVQRVQRLDDAFRLTPLVQSFREEALCMIAGVAPPKPGAPEEPSPQTVVSQPPVTRAAAKKGAAAGVPPLLEQPPPSVAPPPRPPPVAVGAAAPTPPKAARKASADAGAADAVKVAASTAAAAAAAAAASRASGFAAAAERTDEVVRSSSAAARRAASAAHKASRSPAKSLGKKGGGGGLVKVTAAGQSDAYLRHPGDVRVLRHHVAQLYSLWEPSVKLQRRDPDGGAWCDVTTDAELLAAADEGLELAPLLRVQGDKHLGTVDYVTAGVSVFVFAALCVWVWADVWQEHLAAPWLFAATLPVLCAARPFDALTAHPAPLSPLTPPRPLSAASSSAASGG